LLPLLREEKRDGDRRDYYDYNRCHQGFAGRHADTSYCF